MGIENNASISNDGMSRLVSWEVWNFMSFEHAKFEFDYRNIIGIVGYNNSGKSTALRALEVNMYNRFPQSQLSFIKDGKDYFRVVSTWSDGITILRDKYANGQSLYEMWKDDQCVFSTKQNGVLTKVSDVPLCIQQYLNLVKLEDSCLNSRSCFEKQFLVQSSGSENYSVLNTVLKSEELSLASSLVNTDRNKLSSDIVAVNAEYNILQERFKEGIGLSEDLIKALESVDKLLDASEAKSSSLVSVKEITENIARIPVVAEMKQVSADSLNLLCQINECDVKFSALREIPHVSAVDGKQLDLLASVVSCDSKLKAIPTFDKLSSVDTKRVETLTGIEAILERLAEVEQETERVDERLVKLSEESKTLGQQLKEFGVRTVRCKNCGALVEVGGDIDAEQCGCM